MITRMNENKSRSIKLFCTTSIASSRLKQGILEFQKGDSLSPTDLFKENENIDLNIAQRNASERSYARTGAQPG